VEDAVNICHWKQKAGEFEIWLKSRPQVRAIAHTYAEAEEKFLTAIQDAGGAMHAVLEYDPPLPANTQESKYCNPEILLIGSNERFETDAPRRLSFETPEEQDQRLTLLDEFYETPVCRACKKTTSRRSEKPITLSHAPARSHAGFGYLSTDAGPMHWVFNEEFLSLLTPQEKECLKFRPVYGRGRRKFHELVGPEGCPFTGVAGLEPGGWKCPQCGTQVWGYWVEGMSINSFLRASDLPDPLPSVFTVGRFPEIELAVTASRWKELVGLKGTRGICTSRLGIVPDHEAIIPDLPVLGTR
jgi:ribosomal protein L37AE/L43A